MDLLDHNSPSHIYILLLFNTKGDRAPLTWGRNKFFSALPTPLSSIRLHPLRNYRVPLIMSPSLTESDHPQENPSNLRNYQVPLIMTLSLTENHHPQENPSNLQNYRVPLTMSSSLQRTITPKETLRIFRITEFLLSCLHPSQRTITPKKPFESPESPSPSYQAFIPHREPSPPRKPFEPTMVTWDPARSAPPSDSGPEAQGLSISTYESAWDKPFNPDEPKWVPPPRSPLPEGYEYTPPPPPPESHDTSSESEEEIVEPCGYHTSDSESPEIETSHKTIHSCFPLGNERSKTNCDTCIPRR